MAEMNPMDLFMLYLRRKNPQAAAMLGNALANGGMQQASLAPPMNGMRGGGIASLGVDTTPYNQGGNIMGTGAINQGMQEAMRRRAMLEQIAGSM